VPSGLKRRRSLTLKFGFSSLMSLLVGGHSGSFG
jgi:hypothetical protein